VNFDFSAEMWKRVVRTFVQAFIGLYGGANLVGLISGSQPVDVNALRAAGAAGVVAVVTLLWNAVYDPSPLPSLSAAPKED
jgi:hypothetical protein